MSAAVLYSPEPRGYAREDCPWHAGNFSAAANDNGLPKARLSLRLLIGERLDRVAQRDLSHARGARSASTRKAGGARSAGAAEDTRGWGLTKHALSTDLWDAADLETGPHHSTYASERKDGHGRTIATTERFRRNGAIELREVRTQYLPTGEPESITRVNVNGSGEPVQRWMRYDSMGRMVLNAEPNTSVNWRAPASHDDVGDGIKAWRYLYNTAGDLISTSDARGCGQNFFYDGAGRILGEDYLPCEAHHAENSDPNLSSGTGLEVAYYYDDLGIPNDFGVPIAAPPGYAAANSAGRVVAVLDRASATFTTYDARGRVTRLDMRVAKPAVLSTLGKHLAVSDPAERYTQHWYSRAFVFDAADREIAASTGAESLTNTSGAQLQSLLATGNTSTVTTEYSRRGKVKKAGSSYGSLIANIERTADGLVKSITYGDLAQTKTAYLYDERRRVSSVQTYRGPPASGLWDPTAQYTPSTQPDEEDKSTYQLLLQDEDYVYDVVGNPVEIRDWRNPEEWPAGAKPVTKKIQYDDLNRATRIDYQYAAGDDDWVSPFKDELDNDGNPTAKRRAKPSPHVYFEKRPLRQTFEYDWLGNTAKTGDDAKGFYDRSLGTIQNATADAKPYQLKHAVLADSGELWANYDDAGNLTGLNVRRDRGCLGGPTCSQRFEYNWDEVGRLVRARRWDTTDVSDFFMPNYPGDPAADLRNMYDAGDQRVIKEAVDYENDTSSYTVYLFETLELRGAEFTEVLGVETYEATEETAVPYLLANGVRLARIAYEDTDSPMLATPSSEPAHTEEPGAVAASPQLHVFFELGDHLGSTSVVLDKATSELVERSTFQGYGATESDYRPERWKGFREDYKFTGKEEDVEVGLQYFGKRFLNPYLGRWMSADPLAVHAPGEADLNLYAYVRGTVLKSIDPFGLENVGFNPGTQPGGIATGINAKLLKHPVLEMADRLGKAGKMPCAYLASACRAIGRALQETRWQHKLYEEYVKGGDPHRTMKLSLSDSKEWAREAGQSLTPWEKTTKEFYGKLDESIALAGKTGEAQSFHWKGKTGAFFRGPAGFSAHWDVKVTVRIYTGEDGKRHIDSSFKGTLKMTDYYDFDPKEPGKRSDSGEAQTRLGQAIPGTPFHIESGELQVHGNQHGTIVDGVAPKPAETPAKKE